MRNKDTYKEFYQRNLPHIQPINSTLFITYRLAFSLPKYILNELLLKQKDLTEKMEKLPLEKQKEFKHKYQKVLFNIEDDLIAKYSKSPLWLKDDSIAQLVIDDLLFNHQKKYNLLCALIMPNHVHIVLDPLKKSDGLPYTIAEIMENHKKYTARKANKILNRQGRFWHHESYDHYVRDDDEFIKMISYILYNPVEAGLVKNYKDWKHYWVNREQIHWLVLFFPQLWGVELLPCKPSISMY